jgi:hypothetical protein
MKFTTQRLRAQQIVERLFQSVNVGELGENGRGLLCPDDGGSKRL